MGVAEGEVVAEEAGAVAGVVDGEGDWPSVGLVEGDGDGLSGLVRSVTPLLNRSEGVNCG